jgi:lipopolysaccharide/colanic/teichoic acid biosynthesis glycosyltransferase
MSGARYLVVRYRADRVVAVLAAPFAVVVVLILAVWVFLIDGRPIFYWSERCLPDGRAVRLPKVRTFSKSHAEAEFPRRPDGSYEALQSHAELLPGARIVRRIGLDEIPQLLLVARGQLALIGPRPLPRDLAHRFDQAGLPSWVRAGITGPSQVTGRANLSMKEREEVDSRYLREATPRIDLRIALETFTHWRR